MSEQITFIGGPLDLQRRPYSGGRKILIPVMRRDGMGTHVYDVTALPSDDGRRVLVAVWRVSW